MQFDNAQAIYRQIIKNFKKQLIRGEIRNGDKIPSQREYAEKARINPNTVQRAYREMENMNIVEISRGQGTFISISENKLQQIKEEMAREVLHFFIIEMKSMGFNDGEMLNKLQEEQSKYKEVEFND